MARKDSENQKRSMSRMFRGKAIFKPLNTGWIDEHVACVREWVANIFFYTKNGTTIMIDAGYNYERLEEKMGWLDIDPASIRQIFITHQDTDHVGALERDSELLFKDATVYIGEIENRYLTGETRRKVIHGIYKLPRVEMDNRKVLLKDGEIVNIGDIKVECILVPGHTWGHMVFLIDDEYLFTGDTIWFGADGGYSFLSTLAEDNSLALRSLEKLEKNIRSRKQPVKIITGHTGWTDDIDFAFLHRTELCKPFTKKYSDPSAPYDGYVEDDDTEAGARHIPLAKVETGGSLTAPDHKNRVPEGIVRNKPARDNIKHRKSSKVLVFGAGVIGAYLAHVLIKAGNDVTILARKERAESLNRNGLVIYHHLQRKTTADRVNAVTSVEGLSFDAAFVPMPYHKIRQALPQICGLDAKLLILVGNDLAPAEIESYILEHAPGIRKILFGFQVSGGKKEKDRFVCERFGGSWMDIGQLHGETDPRLERLVSRLFAGTSYKLNWQADMEAYLICHPAAILPIAYLSYICEGDLRSSSREQRKLMIDASHEAYECLKTKGIPIYPEGDDRFFENGLRGTAMQFLYLVMAKSKIGDLVACEHCRNAVSEMEQIDLFYEDLMKGYPPEKLKAWNMLRLQMPPWEELHKKYGN